MIVYQAAERTVHECISTLLRQSREDDEDANSHLAAAAHAEGKDSSCLCRLLSYIAKIIADAAAERNSINSFAVNSTGGSAPLSSQSHRRSLSQQQHLPPEPPMNELSHDRATLHLLFAMKTLSYMLTAAGHADGVRMVLVRSVLSTVLNMRNFVADEDAK